MRLRFLYHSGIRLALAKTVKKGEIPVFWLNQSLFEERFLLLFTPKGEGTVRVSSASPDWRSLLT